MVGEEKMSGNFWEPGSLRDSLVKLHCLHPELTSTKHIYESVSSFYGFKLYNLSNSEALLKM